MVIRLTCCDFCFAPLWKEALWKEANKSKSVVDIAAGTVSPYRYLYVRARTHGYIPTYNSDKHDFNAGKSIF
jgi:hypothetical protein